LPKQKNSSKPEQPDFRAELARWRGPKVLLFSVGSENSSDDGAGPELLRRLQGRTSAALLDGGGMPENFVHQAVKAAPEKVLLIDAADFGREPGYFRLFGAEECGGQSFSAHGLTLSMVAKFLRLSLPGCDIALLGIQPACVAPEHKGLSPEVEKTVQILAELLSDK